jgi:Porphyromonas-type peptidyl-arginine deiminase
MSTASAPCRAGVEVVPLPPSARWPEATEAGALGLACAPSVGELARLFSSEGLPLRPDLVRTQGERRCHVLYRPTVPGFRASPDDDPIREILFDSDPLLFLAAGPNRGEPLGVMREVLSRIPRPLDVGILIHTVHEAPAYARAVERGYGHTPHRVKLIERGVERSFWWVQDYLKSGTSSRGETLLVPHRIFEGRPGNGGAFAPLLDALSRQDRVVRSRLSWEGGDLQFTRDPRDPRRLVLYYGDFVKPYWGESLTPEEYAYVLSLEFGADQAVDLGGLAPHVDYFVCFLPREKTALVSVPRSGDLEVARGAVEALLARLASRPPPVLVALRRSLSSPDSARRRAAGLVARARREQSGWEFDVDPGLVHRMKPLVAAACPGEADCFSPAGQLRLVEKDPALFAEWVNAVQLAKDEQAIITAHLDVVESQLDPVPEDVRRRTLEKIAELRALGFRVIRVPAFRVNLIRPHDWPGISYVNGLVVDQQVFLPRFGLGEAEDRIFREVGAQLPAGYAVVPVYAQSVLIRNGGLHCLAGLVRSPSK